MPASIGVNLRVTGHCRQGGRKYMEDFFTVAYQQTEDEKDLEYAFFGIYDGHGGAEAAAFAKEHLMETIIKHKNFWSDNDEDVLRAIKDGYIATHYAMWKEQEKWPKTTSGLPSTAGTTASVAFIRRGKIYIGHVGDSGIILGYQEPGSTEWKAKPLTKDHKPENPEEMKRIEDCGGKVVAKSGVPRVVWNRPKIGHQGPVRRSTPIDEIPFLAVARSLGDLWSYNSQINQFIVSPDPDCSVFPIDTNTHRCLIFGTDGLFNMLSSSMAVHIVQQAERHNECSALSDSAFKTWLNPSKLLVEKALERWHATKMRADNTSVVTLMLDPPGPPRAQVLKDRKKNLPESGLKIINRYTGNGSQEPNRTNKGVQTTDLAEGTTVLQEEEPKPDPITAVPNPNVQDEDRNKEDVVESASSVSSSEIATVLPLKEWNYARESLSFDPREPSRQNSGNDKENNTEAVEDNTIQINEVSSSNIEDVNVEEDNAEDTINKNVRSVLRSSKKVVKSKSMEERRGVKRKLEIQESSHSIRKSLRITHNQKQEEQGEKRVAPCTLAEEKLKKLAEEAERAKRLAECNNNTIVEDRLCISEKVLRSKTVEVHKNKKINTMLETVLGKARRKEGKKPKKVEKVVIANRMSHLRRQLGIGVALRKRAVSMGPKEGDSSTKGGKKAKDAESKDNNTKDFNKKGKSKKILRNILLAKLGGKGGVSEANESRRDSLRLRTRKDAALPKRNAKPKNS